MPSCRNCGAYTKYHDGYCKKCYHGKKFVEHGGNRVSGPSIFGSFFEGETGEALERTPPAVMAIILLLLIGLFSFIGDWFDNRLISILMMGIGAFWIYQRNKRNKRAMRNIKKTLLFSFVFGLILIIVFIINFIMKYDISIGNSQINEITQEFCNNECLNACEKVYKASTANLHASGRGCMCDCMDGKVVLIDEYGNYR